MASAQSTPPNQGSESRFVRTAELPLAVVDLTGKDAREWLQGQVTQDLRGLAPGDSTRACLCKPTGQLLAHLEVWDIGERFRLLVHWNELPALLARIEEAVIMEDVEATVVPASVRHLFGNGWSEPEKTLRLGGFHQECVRWRSRTGFTGTDWVFIEDARLIFESDQADAIDSPILFDVLTLAAGEPVSGIDTSEKTLPPELGPAFEAATISYRKGCYTGQEVLMRMHARGHANRTWRGLLASEPLGAGDRVIADGVEVGRVTRAGVHPTLGPIGAAFLRREAEGKPLTVQTTNGPTAVEARDLPLFPL